MNREIKFRGKRIDNGEWAYGYYAVHKMMLTGEMDYFIIVNEQRPQSIDPETVGQYTGLKDKNGKDIYEADAVDWRGIKYKVCIGEFGVRDFESEGVVDMAYGVYGSPIGEALEPFSFDMQINSVWIKHHNIEVIGNIYTNPELLEANHD